MIALLHKDITVGRCLFIVSERKRIICGSHLVSNLIRILFYQLLTGLPHPEHAGDQQPLPLNPDLPI